MKVIDEATLVKLQKEIASEMLKCICKPCNKTMDKLKDLNLRLDTLNRAAAYIKKPEAVKKS